ncbi:glycosyl hydrolase family 28-related protein [Amycolatopsis sp. NPDC021455]|uniref:rhamnogalacturonidase n=1 Tax=Amycolatopsis sp. NPDC021455 TaxID=3154901 RepID=UPI0033EB5BFD
MTGPAGRRSFLGYCAAGVSLAAVGVSPAKGVSPPFHDVRRFGARGDGTTIDSPAINRAIDAAAAAGGGTVYFPAGTYACYTIRLKSDVALHLGPGATILAAAPTAAGGYDPPGPGNTYQDFGHSHWRAALICGEGLVNVSILGPGRIDGRGLVPRLEPAGPPGAGDKAIALKLCRGVTIADLTIVAGGHIAILATGVDNLTIRDLTVDTIRDGINIDCCRDVHISGTTVNAFNDDAIALKSSYALGFARITENVTITGCTVSGYDVGTLAGGTFRRADPSSWDGDGPFGRIKFGTESNGGFRAIVISGVIFDRCRGISLETVDGGVLEDVTIADVTMREVTSAPIFLRLGARLNGPPGVPVGKLRRIAISNVTAYDADPRYPCTIAGLPGHRVEDVRIRDVRITYRGGLSLTEAAAQPAELINRFFAVPGAREPYAVPERAEAPPEPAMFGVLPAYGFYIRHAEHLAMNDVEVGFTAQDRRPAFVLDDVEDADFHHCRAGKAAGSPTFVLRNVTGFTTRDTHPVPDTHVGHTELTEL